MGDDVPDSVELGSGVWEIEPNHYAAGIPAEEFEFCAAPRHHGRQRQANWCWAACIQMVLNWHGLYVTQEDVVARLFGATPDAPATPDQVIALLSGWLPDSRGRTSGIRAEPLSQDPAQVIADLSWRWPYIVGLKGSGAIGHVVVWSAVTYTLDQNRHPQFTGVVVRDPSPASLSRQELAWGDFVGLWGFGTRVFVDRH